jgi:hypothetical protein
VKKILIMAIIVSTCYALSPATIIHIPSSYSTIQEGINASSDGDTVLVQPGTYIENINFNGHNILLCSMFLPTGDSSYVLNTIVEGDTLGSVINFVNGEDSTATINGFTLRKGYAFHGGAIYCEDSDPIIEHNLLISNFAYNSFPEGGGGIYCLRSSPRIRYNYIMYDTTLGAGGGIQCYESAPLIENNYIAHNWCYG